MAQLVNIKLLLVIAALLASLVGYEAYDHHREAVIEKQRQEVFRPMRSDEKAAQPAGFAEALKKH